MNAPRRRMSMIAGPLLVLGLTGTACGSSGSSNSATGSKAADEPALAAATLNESGSTFQKPFLEEVAKAYKGNQGAVTINVGGGGSGKGKQDLADQVVDIAGSDSIPKPEDKAKFKGGDLLYFPTVAAPITLSYNVSGVDKLVLDAETIAKIFERQVKTWDAQEIKALNPGAKLPSTAITVAHRSDGSGTTSNFTKYLAAAAPSAWTLGAGDTVNWPADTQGGNGNAGVAQIVKSTSGAIGYIDFSDAKAVGLKLADVKNKSGKAITPSLDGDSERGPVVQPAELRWS
jgi:phosphate transport system substrate-binding protein